MRLVIYTNILIASLSSKSKYHWILAKFNTNSYELCITNEILFEYEEKLKDKYGVVITQAFLEFIINHPNINFIEVHYKWNLIYQDQSDNKFVDCYIASASDYLITEDHHFDNLKNIKFPIVQLLKIDQFKNLIDNINQ